MGKPKTKGVGLEGGGEEEEKEKARPAGEPIADITTANNEKKAQAEAGADPAPAPRKRGRPRKVAPKVEENTASLPQQSAATDAESKKQKAENASSTRNGTPSKEHSLTSSKLTTRAPLRREGSRRKSEPRRAAD